MLSADILSAINEKLDVLIKAQEYRMPPAFPSGWWQILCFLLGQIVFSALVFSVIAFVGFYMYAVISLYLSGRKSSRKDSTRSREPGE